MKNNNISGLDHGQMLHRTLDGELEAQRVMIVGGIVPDIKVDIDTSKLEEAFKNITVQATMPEFKMPEMQQSNIQIERMEIPVIVKETVIERIEIPVIVKEYEIKEIHVPYEVIKVVEIEKPMFIKEQVIQYLPTKETNYLRIIAAIEAVLLILMLFKK